MKNIKKYTGLLAGTLAITTIVHGGRALTPGQAIPKKPTGLYQKEGIAVKEHGQTTRYLHLNLHQALIMM